MPVSIEEGYVPMNMTSTPAPLHPQAIVLPLIAFPSWILCVSPFIWQFRQGNIAAASLILWVGLMNLSVSFNSLIWPRDNIHEWWNGRIWCDIQVRIQVGAVVGTTASAAMIVRKLAKVMDTRNLTVSSSKNLLLKEKIVEVIWCWGYPLVLIVVYYVVQPARYMIYGIVGCLSPFDSSWPSIVLSYMWAPITIAVAACYASILSYRLYRYRREFVHLVTARNTTQCRFIRLYIISMIIIIVYVPYTCWLLAVLCRLSVNPYSWSRVHDPTRFNSIIKIPASGQVAIDKWAHVATGYVVFFVFGTGSDAYNKYKRLLQSVGLGKVFPRLFVLRDNKGATASSFMVPQTWISLLSSKSRGMFSSKTDSILNSVNDDATQITPAAQNSMSTLRQANNERMDFHQDKLQGESLIWPSYFARMRIRRAFGGSILPLFRHRSVTEISIANPGNTIASDNRPAISGRPWAIDGSAPNDVSQDEGVNVLNSMHLDL